MSDEHRLGVDPVNLVVRHLKLEPAEQENIFNAIEEIDQVYGLDSVQYEAKNNSIHLAYVRVVINQVATTLMGGAMRNQHH